MFHGLSVCEHVGGPPLNDRKLSGKAAENVSVPRLGCVLPYILISGEQSMKGETDIGILVNYP